MKYIRLPNGEKLKCYDCIVDGGTCLIKFVNTDISAIKEFLGTEILNYIDVLDEEGSLEKSFDIYAKRKQLLCDDQATIQEKEYRILKEEHTETLPPITGNNGTVLQEEQTIYIPEEVEVIYKDVQVEMITAILEKPSLHEELDSLKKTVGIVNPNNMSLDEFKHYYKSIIGEQCSAAIYKGCSVDTAYGSEHFSYTLEDQSNIKDLVMTILAAKEEISLPYHADGTKCTRYSSTDILKIYTALTSHKLYHTTYCNILNRLIDSLNSINNIKAVNYGMDIKEEAAKTMLEDIVAQGNKTVIKLLERYTGSY